MKFLDTLYVRDPSELHRIIMFGRDPVQRATDSAHGVARIGGPMREPNYAQAYLHAASVLIGNAEQTDSLDEIALPAFYLQRHACELLLKQALSLLVDISIYEARLAQHAELHTAQQKQRLDGSHDLAALLSDVQALAGSLKLPSPPRELLALVDCITAIEVTQTWPRYSTSSATKKRPRIQHMEQEMSVPLREIQRKLEEASKASAYRASDDQSYEYVLYEEWHSYALQFGDVG